MRLTGFSCTRVMPYEELNCWIKCFMNVHTDKMVRLSSASCLLFWMRQLHTPTGGGGGDGNGCGCGCNSSYWFARFISSIRKPNPLLNPCPEPRFILLVTYMLLFTESKLWNFPQRCMLSGSSLISPADIFRTLWCLCYKTFVIKSSFPLSYKLCHRSEILQVLGISLNLWELRVCHVNQC